MSQHVSIWGVFPTQQAAGKALAQLELDGFRASQIAIQKNFKEALAEFPWSHALYVRLPEGIVAGFAGGAVLSILLCFVVSRGIPPLIALAVVGCAGSVAGTVLGAFGGLLLARFEVGRSHPNTDNKVSIGVLCFDPRAEVRAKQALIEAGAAIIGSQ